MNVVFLSPHFPPNFANFCIRLKEEGANVLGLADSPYDTFSPELRAALSEYYKVNSLESYDSLMRALGYFIHRYGRIGVLDSLNEHWLETEARLRTDFNIPGINCDTIDSIKRKSEMKRVFREAGLNPCEGQVCRNEKEMRDFIKKVGYPVAAKPDIGVGAAKTYKIQNDDQIEHFWKDKLPVDYIVEEFVDAPIVSFDGLVDGDGNLVFCSSLRYSMGVMAAVNENSDLYYYFSRKIEPMLEDAGKRILKAFGIKSRFFHFEFFMKSKDEVIPLEVNMRPPGGLTLDMFNFANDFDCYRAWAQVVLTGRTDIVENRAYHVIYVSRKDHIGYSHSHEQILDKFSDLLVLNSRIEDVFAPAIGNHGYVLRDPELEPLIDAAGVIHERSN